MKTLLFFLLLPASLAAQSWTHMGPLSLSGTISQFETGRVNRLHADPGYDNSTNHKLYASSHTGGLWVTTDDGDNWSNINTDYMNYSGVSDIAIDGTNNIVYVADINSATGRFSKYKDIPSTGVYKYFPATGTWAATAAIPFSGLQTFRINTVHIHPSNPQIIFICTSQGIFRSLNGGTSWSSVYSGAEFEDMQFIPRNNGTVGTYPYLIYASGFDQFVYSSDDGSTYSSVSVVASQYSLVSGAYAATSYVHDNVTGDDDIFIYAYAHDAANAYMGDDRNYILYRFVYNQTAGTQTCTKLTALNTGNQSDITPTRLCVSANAPFSVYFGAVSLFHYNLTTSARSTMSGPHDDQHGFAMLAAYNKFFEASDGGVIRCTYTPTHTPDDGFYSRTFTKKNIGLHIAQVWGFSSSEQEEDVFMTGEVDHLGFSGVLFTTGTTSGYRRVGGHEAPGALIDIYDKDFMITRSSAYGDGYQVSKDHYATFGTGVAMFSAVTDFCTTAGNATETPEFERNSFFQDPYRADRIYYGGVQLYQLCKSISPTPKFVLKYRPTIFLTGTGNPKLELAAWNQTITAMGFAKQDKNKVYMSFTNLPGSNAGQLVKFTGADIDDSWQGHNENGWTNITPDYNSLGFITTPLTTAEYFQTWFTGIAVSELNPDRIWVGCFDIPHNPTVKVLKYESGVWTDYSLGIPFDEYPISMTYERGSNDGVFVGTNRAVYYRNATMSGWMLFSTDLPHVPVSQIDINYEDNTVRAAMWGRGIWRCDLPCPTPPDLVLSSVTYSTNTFKEASNSITASNVTVNGGDVRFRAGGYIDLLPTFTAISSTGTSFFAYIHGCGTDGSTMRSGGQDDEDDDPDVPEIDMALSDNVTIAPNPNNGQFMLTRNFDTPLHIEVYDLNGRILFSHLMTGENQLPLDFSAQPKGLYLVRSWSDEKVTITKVIIR